MGQQSRIEWTDSTWNPVTGCTQVSAGCDNCYALSLANRRLRDIYLRHPAVRPEKSASDPFAVRLWRDRLHEPLSWQRPRMVFVNSMSDLFHADVPESYVRELFEVMLRADRHIYQVLTKRPSRAARFVERNKDLFVRGRIPAHIWMGTSVESQEVTYRVDHLRSLAARVRFLSCEPLLGPLRLTLRGIHWVIAGGESGRGYRPLSLEWVRSIRDQCLRGRVPFFFKQVGGYTPKAGGRLLDGQTWDEFPFLTTGRGT
ncbi:MAG: phage Gp37/Gp68 family protein [Gemmatimonadota bacterium]|nr:phage Gp37/Gp68 family protein [Gemmatimonadota bacterium]